jgi:hypothetical protein
VAADRQALALLQHFALEQHQQLQAGGVHFADAGKVEFEVVGRRQRGEQLFLLRLRLVDRHVLVDDEAVGRGSLHGDSSWVRLRRGSEQFDVARLPAPRRGAVAAADSRQRGRRHRPASPAGARRAAGP